jgi:hypothetical protein
MSRGRARLGLLSCCVAAALAACTSGPLHGEGTPCDPDRNPCRSFLMCDPQTLTCVARAHDGSIDVPAVAEVGPDVPAAIGGADGGLGGSGEPAIDADDEPLPNIPGSLDKDEPPPPVPGPGRWPSTIAAVCWERGRPAGEAGNELPARMDPAFASASAAIRDALGVLSRPSRLGFELIGTPSDPTSQDCLSIDPAGNRQLVSVWFGAGPPSVAPAADPIFRAARVRLDPASPTLRADAIEAFSEAVGVPLQRTPSRAGLFPAEIITLRDRFGFKPAGSLVSLSGLCIDVRSTGADTPPVVQLATCNVALLQRLHFETTGELAILDGMNDKCLDRAPAPPGALVPATCETVSRQAFAFSNVLVRGVGDRCLAAEDARLRARVALQPCDDPRQPWVRWDVLPRLSRKQATAPGLLPPIALRLAGTDLCLDEDPAGPRPGTRPTLQPCADRHPYLWYATGELRAGDWCLFTPPENWSEGAWLGWDACSPLKTTPAQSLRFHLTGAVRTYRGADCLDTTDPLPPEPRARALLAPCDDRRAAGQTWDFIP